jgi:carbamoyltransferase
MIIAVLVENIRRVAAHFRYYADEHGARVCYAKPYFLMVGGRLELHHVPPSREPVDESSLPPGERQTVDRVVRYPRIGKLLAKTGTMKLAYKLLRRNPYPQYRRPNDPTWQVMRTILSEWINEHSKPVLLMPIPLYFQIEEFCSARDYQARFREVAAEAGCQLHDPLPDLMGYPALERRGFRFKTDIHFSPNGHEALAKSLAPVVQRTLQAQT